MTTQRPAEVTGIELARGFFTDLVRPVLTRELPGLRYAAGRLGSGSDVLGLDDATSRDHDWGCRLTLLVDAADQPFVSTVDDLLGRELPESYRGWPVRFAMTWDERVHHRVQVDTAGGFAASRLGVDPTGGLSPVDWLSLPGHSVLEVTAGPLFVDMTTELGPLREGLAWYPPDLDRYVLTVAWGNLARLMPSHARTDQRGQHLQSRLIAAAMATELIRLAFLVCRSFMPYEKWFEALFRRLPVAAALAGPLERLVGGAGLAGREAALAEAVDVLLAAQRDRGRPTPAVGLVPFFNRDQSTVALEVTDLLFDGITDPDVLALPERLGTIEQWAYRHDVVFRLERRAAIVAAYRAWMAA
jgi:Domain of unknown function (DUF4037)